MELSEFVVDFKTRIAIKLQILSDFVVEWTEPGFIVEGAVPESAWHISCDGAWGIAGARAAAILRSHYGIKLCTHHDCSPTVN
jgi:hypothetical protein